MTTYGWLIFALWLTLVVYWSVSSRAVTRRLGGRWTWWREIAMRLGFFAVVVVALRVTVIAGALPNAGLDVFGRSAIMGLVGFACVVFGMGLAMLARAYLGGNWGVSSAKREEAVLITTGPYARVRHPLYGGMLFAILGSAIGQSVLWLLPLLVYGPYFIRAARREEKQLRERFPDHYPAYMKRTRMLLPFVL
jgi:protein-S-isoprenylcysteine O-methyltransferase Ste14